MIKKLYNLKRNKKKGFTLVELIVVIAIILVLMAILVPLLSKYIDDANEAKNNANARAVYSAAAAYASSEIAKNGSVAAGEIYAEKLKPYFGNSDGATITALINADGSVAWGKYEKGNKEAQYPKQKNPEES